MSTSKKQAGVRKCSLLIVVKGEHKYMIKYGKDRKAELFDLLLAHGQDDGCNLTTFDALALIENMEETKAGTSVISLGEDEPGVQRDLTYENPSQEAGDLDIGLDF